MEKELSQEFMDKVQKVAQGPDADLLYDMVDCSMSARLNTMTSPSATRIGPRFERAKKPLPGENLSPWRS